MTTVLRHKKPGGATMVNGALGVALALLTSADPSGVGGWVVVPGYLPLYGTDASGGNLLVIDTMTGVGKILGFMDAATVSRWPSPDARNHGLRSAGRALRCERGDRRGNPGRRRRRRGLPALLQHRPWLCNQRHGLQGGRHPFASVERRRRRRDRRRQPSSSSSTRRQAWPPSSSTSARAPASPSPPAARSRAWRRLRSTASGGCGARSTSGERGDKCGNTRPLPDQYDDRGGNLPAPHPGFRRPAAVTRRRGAALRVR